MKKNILLLIFSFALNSFFSQDSDLVQCIKKNIKIESVNDSLTKLIISIKNDQKELTAKLEDEKKSLEDERKSVEDVKKENKKLKDDLADIKKKSYSKTEYTNAIAKKDQVIDALKIEFKELEEQLKRENKKLADNNKSTLSILSEMNGTFFEKKIRDNYTLDYIKNHPFKREDSLTFKKYDAMIISLNADPSMEELKSSKILEKAAVYNDYYFNLLDVYATLDFEYDSVKVAKSLLKMNSINIPAEFEGLLISKIEINQRLTEYCKIQADLFKNLKTTDKIQDKNQRFNKIVSVSKLDKFKHYKYLKETILQYATEKFDLTETNCTSK